MPHSPGVLDFAFVLVNSVVNLPDKWGQLSFFWGWGGGVGGVGVFKLQKNCNESCLSKIFWGGAATYTKPPKRHLPNFPTPKNSRITKFKPKKSLDHPCHLKSGVPPLGL